MIIKKGEIRILPRTLDLHYPVIHLYPNTTSCNTLKKVNFPKLVQIYFTTEITNNCHSLPTNNIQTKCILISFDVSGRSVLGPLLYVIYLNSLLNLDIDGNKISKIWPMTWLLFIRVKHLNRR